MILTADQINQCKKTIGKYVKYQETLDEVVDHVVSAIELQPEAYEPLETMVQHVLDQDFGGKSNLRAMEQERAKMAFKALNSKQWEYFKQHFRLPLIGFTLVLAVASYLMVDTYINRKAFVLAMLLFSFSPMMLLCFQTIKRRSKLSIKTALLVQVNFISISVFNVLNFIPRLFNYKIFMQSHAAILAILTVFFITYTLSFIKLYREEVKIKVA
ncbi:hypothetical protein MUY27_10795 [Mucilaginibacter sp. RS28]|uniref:Uncharacterized protein n=1 Tax=Mucilaginibacter straminoryzae TaxID=2932774 RepID=A0A9X1X7V2_9SPHI|nr:hypothetical protein [Mucilaginibacter straminoryzae]MCJ8210199.1 hypothetical protein [Mucilaginibacter straminoryzae]